MATPGNIKLNAAEKPLQVEGAKVIIIKTAWNHAVTDALALGSERILTAHKVQSETYTVPGAVELTFAVRHLYNTRKDIDAFITLGCVIRGDTPHFDYVCQSVTQGITLLNTQLGVPVIFGILTVNTEEQARERIGGRHGHKGEEAAFTAMQMIDFMRQG